MNSTFNFLVEIGCEELPPKALLNLSKAFRESVEQQINKLELAFSGIDSFATPRRLALRVNDLDHEQKTTESVRLGPAVASAFNEDGSPKPAAIGFAKSCGLDIGQLDQVETDKGVRLQAKVTQVGKKSSDLLPEIVEQALKSLPIPKMMRWGAGSIQFVRPIHWVVMLADTSVINCEILGTSAGALSRGHRFHSPDFFTLSNAKNYEKELKDHSVTVSFAERRQTIVNQAKALCPGDAELVLDDELLDEVTALVELPNALLGSFDPAFLEVPPECLISAMREHQKYFHLLDKKDGSLKASFVTVSNIKSKNPQAIIEGNEKVIRPRLADAQFFFEKDKARSLDSMSEQLNTILFQKKLGSIGDKTRRLGQLSQVLAKLLGADAAACSRAAALCKADLVSDMVGEFPELQGNMGKYYAELSGENREVCLAIEEHYLPRFAGDSLPTTKVGTVVALAEKLDTLVGIIGIGQLPTGAKDPFSLRRAALGIVRVITELKLELKLTELVELTQKGFSDVELDPKTVELCVEFINARQKAYYQDQGIPTQIINAVLAKNIDEPYDFNLRINALNTFIHEEACEALASATKRCGNILRKEGAISTSSFDSSLVQHDAETQLANIIAEVEGEIKQADHAKSLSLLAQLKEPIDNFFDSVLVNDKDEKVRQNRISLLNQLYRSLTSVADIGLLDIKS